MQEQRPPSNYQWAQNMQSPPVYSPHHTTIWTNMVTGQVSQLDILQAHLPNSHHQLALAIQNWDLSWQVYAYLQEA